MNYCHTAHLLADRPSLRNSHLTFAGSIGSQRANHYKHYTSTQL
jgi:hypothetical protein